MLGRTIAFASFSVAVGFGSGIIRLVDGLSLEDVAPQPLRYAHDAITHISFSHDGMYLASAVGDSFQIFAQSNKSLSVCQKNSLI